MPRLPDLAPIPFEQLRRLYEAPAHEAPPGTLVGDLLAVAPQWRFQTCTACDAAICLSVGWRGLYWTCSACSETGSVDAEAHERLVKLVEPGCPECGESLQNSSWSKGNYLPCRACDYRTGWSKLRRAVEEARGLDGASDR